ncbi:MAG: DUF3500 domain-containing protein [Bacteroidota bacterium]
MKKALILLFSISLFSVKAQTNFNQKASVIAAKAFIESLSNEQKAKALFAFEAPNRTQWSNLPMEQVTREGLWMNDIKDNQKIHVHNLLQSVLSENGYLKVMFIMQYDEDIKQRLTNANSPIAQRYGHEKYWVSIFGDPAEGKIWGWKFEGHHISLNLTYSANGVTCSPMFTGINPALTSAGPFAGRYIMKTENEVGKDLFNSLTASQQSTATLGTHPTNADPMAQTGLEPFFKESKGVLFTEMTKKQQDMVFELMNSWVENLNAELANDKMNAMLRNVNNIRFAWMGTNDTSKLHYYRIYAPNFSFEMTNRDGAIQHLHSLWRFLDEDFKVK